MANLQNIPEIVQKAFNKVYIEAIRLYGEDNALPIANAWLKSRLVQTGDSYIGNSKDFISVEILSFQLEPANIEFITNSDNGEFIMNATLSSTENWTGKDGTLMDISYSEECLKDFESQINLNGLTLPDIEHQEFDAVLKEYSHSPELFAKEISKRKGLLKDIKAKYENGKLFISAKLDKRYHKYAEFYQNLSLEALAKREGNKFTGGKIVGFTFTKNPIIKSAKIDSI